MYSGASRNFWLPSMLNTRRDPDKGHIVTIVPYANSLDPDETPSRRLSRIQAVWHSDNNFSNFEQLRSALKLISDETDFFCYPVLNVITYGRR